MKNNYENLSKERLKALYHKREVRIKELYDLAKLLNKYSILTSTITKDMILEKLGEEELERVRLHWYILLNKDISNVDKESKKRLAINYYKHKLKW